jgi:transposase
MLAWPGHARVHLALGVTDMRKGFDGLAALVQTVLRVDPFSGHTYEIILPCDGGGSSHR